MEYIWMWKTSFRVRYIKLVFFQIKILNFKFLTFLQCITLAKGIKIHFFSLIFVMLPGPWGMWLGISSRTKLWKNKSKDYPFLNRNTDMYVIPWWGRAFEIPGSAAWFQKGSLVCFSLILITFYSFTRIWSDELFNVIHTRIVVCASY